MPYLSKILIYPIKSLDGVEVKSTIVLAGGSLYADREFAMVDDQGRLVNGKRTAKVHQLRTQYDLEKRVVFVGDDHRAFHLDTDRFLLEQWLSNFFGFAISLQQNCQTGFPDDLISPGPTVIGVATLHAVAQWFPEVNSLTQMRERFRSNLEIADTPPFWEDCLFGKLTETIPFRIGNILLEGINPCQRCPVPTRDPLTGAVYPHFQSIFSQQRSLHLPNWADRSRFNHFYRLAVNTRLASPETGKILTIGAEVQCQEKK